MKCGVCEKKFILSRNQEDYLIKKQKMDEEHCKYVGANFEKDKEGCWIKVMNEKALLLKVNQNPIFCPAEVCGAMICDYCYALNKQYYEKNRKCPACNYTY
jgi:hypothetical protein